MSTQPLMPPDEPAGVAAGRAPTRLRAGSTWPRTSRPCQLDAPVAAAAPAPGRPTRTANRPIGPDRPPDAALPGAGARGPATARPGSSRCATRRAASARPRRTINLGAALAEYGRKVLLVDFDPQGSLSVGLGVNPLRARPDRLQPAHGARTSRSTTSCSRPNVPGLDLLPSNIDLSAAEVQLVNEVAREQILQPGAARRRSPTTTSSSSTASRRSACSRSTR